MLLDNVLIAAIPPNAWKEKGAKGGAREKRDLIKLAIKMSVGRAQARCPLSFNRFVSRWIGKHTSCKLAESRLLIENERVRFYPVISSKICVIRRCFSKLCSRFLFLLASVDPRLLFLV